MEACYIMKMFLLNYFAFINYYSRILKICVQSSVKNAFERFWKDYHILVFPISKNNM